MLFLWDILCIIILVIYTICLFYFIGGWDEFKD
nr:MAG TPA: protein of unknown function (DUF3844) [Bacteriophage sp.]DAT35001.1 MAG TPA: protein of unknown function (DUF3844) [Bacteriophage sp.]